MSLEAVGRLNNLPKPDLIKMDIQGAELDVLKGAADYLVEAEHIILGLQRVEYNKGAPLRETVLEYMDKIGYDCMGMFMDNNLDGDYHFVKR